jgi:hypothetical protein
MEFLNHGRSTPSILRIRFFVVLALVWDLLLFAKYLFVAANHSKGPVLPGCPQLRTISECNNCRSPASRLDTNRAWVAPAPCRSPVRSSCRSKSNPPGTVGRAVSVAVVAGIAARWRALAAAQSR